MDFSYLLEKTVIRYRWIRSNSIFILQAGYWGQRQEIWIFFWRIPGTIWELNRDEDSSSLVFRHLHFQCDVQNANRRHKHNM